MRSLDRVAAERGYPAAMVMGNGPEFTDRALDQWTYDHELRLEFIQRAKPMQNGFAKATTSDAFRNSFGWREW